MTSVVLGNTWCCVSWSGGLSLGTNQEINFLVLSSAAVLPFLPLVGFRRECACFELLLFVLHLPSWAEELGNGFAGTLDLSDCPADKLPTLFLLYASETSLVCVSSGYLHYFPCRVGLGALALGLAPWDSTAGVAAVLQSVSFPEWERDVLHRKWSQMLSWCIDLEFQSRPCCKVGALRAWVKAELRISQF